MIIIYTGTPPNIKVNGTHFRTGHPVEVPDMVGELLIQKPFFSIYEDDDYNTKYDHDPGFD